MATIIGCGSGVVRSASDALQVSPNSIDFGAVNIGQTGKTSVAISNVGLSAVSISQLNVSGQAFSVFGSDALPINIPPSGTYTFAVGFAPVASINYSGKITMLDATSKAIAQLQMQGTGKQWSGSNAGTLTVSAAELIFGNVPVNTSATESLTLTATGTSPVTINSAMIAGAGFTLVAQSLPVTLNPSQSLPLQVRFSPSATGTASGQLTISSNSSTGSSTVVALSGAGTAAATPQLTVSAASLNFGDLTVNNSAMQSLMLTSTGTSPVTVNSATITGAGFTLVAQSLPVTLNPSQSLPLQVRFSPAATGTASGQLTISSNSSTGSSTVVALSGTGTAAATPQLTVSAAGLNFGDLTVNNSAMQSLMLTSTGTSPVTVNSAMITGAGFTLVAQSLPATLNPSQSLPLQVRFSPAVTGTASGQLTISSNSSTGSSTVVALSGAGTAAATPQLTVSAAGLNFGDLTVNNSAMQSLMLTSTGTSPVTVNSATITGAGFTLVAQSLPATLNPSQSLPLQVRFSPAVTGTASGQLTISSNSSTGSSAVVALSGTGTAAATPQLTVSAASLNFGNLTVDNSATQTLTLTSTGTSPVTVNSAMITGAGFTIVAQSLPVTVNPSQSLPLQVRFSPAVTGTASGQLTISSNSSTGSSAVVALSGTGTAAAHNVTLSWDAPADSEDPVAGYNIYRATGSGPFVVINPSPDLRVTYVDNTVVSGTSYTYEVTSVDSNGTESVPSNQVTVTIP